MFLGSVNPKLDRLDTAFSGDGTAAQPAGLSPGPTSAEEMSIAVSTNQEKNGRPGSSTQVLAGSVKERMRTSPGKKLKRFLHWIIS
jgi:hypothetical protein